MKEQYSASDNVKLICHVFNLFNGAFLPGTLLCLTDCPLCVCVQTHVIKSLAPMAKALQIIVIGNAPQN